MTHGNSHIVFKTVMDKNSISVAFGGSPAFLPEEIDTFLNQGLTEIVVNKLTGNNSLQVPFEGNVKRVDDLERLVKTDYRVPMQSDTLRASNCYRMEGKFEEAIKDSTRRRMFYINSVIDAGKGKYPCKLISHLQSNRFVIAHDNKPWIPEPVVFLEDGYLYALVDSYDIQDDISINLTYIDTPPTIDYTKADEEIEDIPDNVMVEAINRAVVIALDNIEQPRLQSKVQINSLQE